MAVFLIKCLLFFLKDYAVNLYVLIPGIWTIYWFFFVFLWSSFYRLHCCFTCYSPSPSVKSTFPVSSILGKITGICTNEYIMLLEQLPPSEKSSSQSLISCLLLHNMTLKYLMISGLFACKLIQSFITSSCVLNSKAFFLSPLYMFLWWFWMLQYR